MSNINSVQNKTKPLPTNFSQVPPKTSKGVGDTKDSISKHPSNITYEIAQAFCRREETSIQTHKIRLSEIQGVSTKVLAIQKEVSEVLNDFIKTKQSQPLLEAAKKIAKSMSVTANAVMGFELLSVGAPLVSSIFLTSAVLASADLSGFFKEYKTYLDGLNLASSLAVVGAGSYANALTDIGSRIFTSAVFFLNGVVDAGSSFNRRTQNLCQAQYLELQGREEKAEFALNHFLKAIEQSFDDEEGLRRNIQHQILVNLNLDS